MAMYRIRTVFTGVLGTPYYSNLYFALEGGTHVQARQAATNFWFAMSEDFVNDLLFTVEPDVAVLDEATGDVIQVLVDNAPKGRFGQSAATALPPATQILVRLRSGVFNSGREIRGRIFIPGVTVSQSNDGRVQGGTIVDVQAAIDAMIADQNAQLVVWAKTRGTYAVVNSATVWTEFAVLRSRRD